MVMAAKFTIVSIFKLYFLFSKNLRGEQLFNFIDSKKEQSVSTFDQHLNRKKNSWEKHFSFKIPMEFQRVVV